MHGKGKMLRTSWRRGAWVALLWAVTVIQGCFVDFGESSRAECGNSVLDPGEECDGDAMNGVSFCSDLGYQGNSVRCRSDCHYDLSECIVPCGNGVIDEGELCDDGNNDTSDSCPSGPNGTCRPAVCGDGFVWQGHEQCDDGNRDEGDACSSDCSLPGCGDGIVEEGEECDEGGLDTETCDSDCTIPRCGDGHVNHVVGETCDDGNEETTDACPSGPDETCQPAICGDGFTWTGHETCDDGNEETTDACPSGPDGTCQPATCGDGFTWTGHELCDDGNRNNNDACPDDAEAGGKCEPAFCGDYLVWNQDGGNEECDSGGRDSTDCDADCTAVVCGDGHINQVAGEECDDRNSIDGDGCSAHCLQEEGWRCLHEPSLCTELCGDGYVVGSEECDPPGLPEESTLGCVSGTVKTRECQSDCSWSAWSACHAI